MLNRFAAALLCCVAPVGISADPVELRSSDGFISVVGEIVDFNGVMLSIETSVGKVSVPASEVICYGAGCRMTLAENNFGLTEDAFEAVIENEEPQPIPQPRLPQQDRKDEYVVGLAHSSFERLYSTVTGAFAVAGITTSIADLTTRADQVVLHNGAGNETAVLTKSDSGDLTISTVSLRGSESQVYGSSPEWATTRQPSHQLIGLNAFAVIVAPEVQINALSIAQLAGIYAGEITNWSEVDGPDMAILPLQQPVNSLARDDLIALVMEPAGKVISDEVLTMADAAGIATSVNQFPGSISVVSVDAATDNKTVAIAGSCNLANMPTDFSILSGDYPLVRPVMVEYARPPETKIITDLFDFAVLSVVQGLLRRHGFIDMSVIQRDVDGKNERLSQILASSFNEVEKPAGAAMFQTLLEAERLSPTILGGITSGPEGGWNRAMFHILRDMLAEDMFDGREVVFVGFANSARGPQAAIDVSVAAAAQVSTAFSEFAAELAADNELTFTSRGFGRVAPVACYDGQVSKDSYSRVEVWVRDRN